MLDLHTMYKRQGKKLFILIPRHTYIIEILKIGLAWKGQKGVSRFKEMQLPVSTMFGLT